MLVSLIADFNLQDAVALIASSVSKLDSHCSMLRRGHIKHRSDICKNTA